MPTAEELYDQQDKNWRWMVARANRFEAALQAIANAYIPDQPSAYNDDDAWAARHVSTLRQMAREALSE